MTCVYSDNFLNLTLYLDLLLVAGSHPAKDETSLLLYIGHDLHILNELKKAEMFF